VEDTAIIAAAPTCKIGQATVTRIPERSITFPASALLPDWDAAVASCAQGWLVPEHMNAAHTHLTASVHSWLVKTETHRILIDTGIGNGKTRASPLFNQLDTPFLDRLAAAGCTPEEVTHVLLTHIHTDHVGWNTSLEGGLWIPTFANARYFIPRAGCNSFNAPHGRLRPDFDMYADSILPVIKAGQAELVDPTGGEVLDGFTYHPTPGHSIDHMSILLSSQGEEAIFAGDVMHHPSQIGRPRWNSVFCADPEQAEDSRRRVLDYASERSMVYFSSHFAGSSAGRISRDGDAYRWQSI
jgi:glyoxylase-like metal-dependent hydrolase (beta-lactamase superfamily II)